MDASLMIKIAVFIILALFASWPYFEKVLEYHWWKRLLIGLAIAMLLILGVMDIVGSENKVSREKKELTDTTVKLSGEVRHLDSNDFKLNCKIDSMKSNQNIIDKKEDEREAKREKVETDREKKEDERDAKLDKLTIFLQQNHGDISKAER